MPELKEHTMLIGGLAHTVLLDEDDARRYAATEVKKAPEPANKARTGVQNK